MTTTRRDDVLCLLRVAWEHGGEDAFTYAEERSTRALARMNDSYADEAWSQWVHGHEGELDRLAPRSL